MISQKNMSLKLIDIGEFNNLQRRLNRGVVNYKSNTQWARITSPLRYNSITALLNDVKKTPEINKIYIATAQYPPSILKDCFIDELESKLGSRRITIILGCAATQSFDLIRFRLVQKVRAVVSTKATIIQPNFQKYTWEGKEPELFTVEAIYVK